MILKKSLFCIAFLVLLFGFGWWFSYGHFIGDDARDVAEELKQREHFISYPRDENELVERCGEVGQAHFLPNSFISEIIVGFDDACVVTKIYPGWHK